MIKNVAEIDSVNILKERADFISKIVFFVNKEIVISRKEFEILISIVEDDMRMCIIFRGDHFEHEGLKLTPYFDLVFF